MSMRCMLVMRGMRGDILSCYGIATLSPIRHSASTDHNDLPSGGNNDTGRHLSPVSGAADDRDGLVAWHFVEMLRRSPICRCRASGICPSFHSSSLRTSITVRLVRCDQRLYSVSTSIISNCSVGKAAAFQEEMPPSTKP